MHKTFAAIAIAAAAMTTSAAFAESTVVESRNQLAQLQAEIDRGDRQVSRGSDNFLTRTFGAVDFSFIQSDATAAESNWGDNYRGGRVSPPAGR